MCAEGWIIRVGDEAKLGLRVRVLDEDGKQIGLVQWVDLKTLEFEKRLLEPYDENTHRQRLLMSDASQPNTYTVPFQTNPDGSIKTTRGFAARIEITKKQG